VGEAGAVTAFVAHYDDFTIGVRLGEAIGSGAVGDIHRLQGRPGLVAKVYRTTADRAAYEQKIADMIRDPPDLPPLMEDGREYPQIAWPVAALRDPDGVFVGFVMPEIDMKAATELENVLQKVSRRVRKLPEFYGGRVLLAANLAAVMAELHGHGHYFVDMKPINIRFYPGSWYLAILDTDGFSVQGTTRWPARQFSEEYIAPEARTEAPDALGLEQDLFALAVIIFRLLNNGLHPYQGLDARPDLPTTLQERIFAGLYAYGRTPSAEVRPAPATIHDSFEDSTRELFDRAFGGDPAARPTAQDWKVHLQELVTGGVLRKCSRHPDEHMHFSRACGLCALDARRAVASRPPSAHAVQPGVQLGGAALGAPSQRPPPPSPSATPRQAGKWIGVTVIALIILGALLAGERGQISSIETPVANQLRPQVPQAPREQEAAAATIGTQIDKSPSNVPAAGWRAFADDSAPPRRLQLRGLAIDARSADMVAAADIENASPGQTSLSFEIRDGTRVAGACPTFVVTAASGRVSCQFRRLSLAPGLYQLVAGSEGNDLATTTFVVEKR